MASLAEAWGDPEMHFSNAPEESELTLEDVHNLPGYNPYCSYVSNYEPTRRQAQPQKKRVSNKQNVQQRHQLQQQPQQQPRQQNNVSLQNYADIQQLIQSFDPTSHKEILNALLYVVSGIYLIYTMDMFLRMGMNLSR